MGYYKLLPKLKSWEIEEFKSRFDSNYSFILKSGFAVFLFFFLFIIIYYQALGLAMEFADDSNIYIYLEKMLYVAVIEMGIFIVMSTFLAIILLFKEYKWIKEKEKKYKMCGV